MYTVKVAMLSPLKRFEVRVSIARENLGMVSEKFSQLFPPFEPR